MEGAELGCCSRGDENVPSPGAYINQGRLSWDVAMPDELEDDIERGGKRDLTVVRRGAFCQSVLFHLLLC